MKMLLKLLVFNFIIFNSLFSSQDTTQDNYRIGLPEYRITCSPIGLGTWTVTRHGNCIYMYERVTGRHRVNRVDFEFTREIGSWQDFLTTSNDYENCLLQQGYQYLQSGSRSGYTFSNISPLQWQEHRSKRVIPFIEGIYFDNTFGHVTFRLYMFPTRDEQTTYYLYITIMDYKDKKRFDEYFKEVFNFVGACK